MSKLVRQSVERMQGYVPGEQPRGGGIVKLNTNENPYPPSPHALAALRNLDGAALARYPDPACRAVCERLAERHGRGPEQIFVGNGSDEVLALCTRAFVENDGSIGCLDPSYSLYPVLAAIRDVPLLTVPLGPDFEWPRPDPPQCSLFFLTNPNAPTGIQVPPEALQTFCEGAAGVVVIDEAYVDFAETDCLALVDACPNTLVARTLSKSYSLAGVRLGYAVGAPSLMDALRKIKDSYNVDIMTQRVALAALNDVEHMQSNAGRIRLTRARLTAELDALGFRTYPSQTNFIWTRPPARPAAEWFDALRRRRILVRYFPGARTGGHLRITVGTDEEVDRLLSAVREELTKETAS